MKEMKDWFNLQGKVAIVTGGGRNIGKAIATGLAAIGADIAIVARDEAEITQAVGEIKGEFDRSVIGVKCDVSKPEQIKDMVGKVLDAFGRIDILVNNAGRGCRRLPQDLSIEDWQLVQDTNARSVWLCSKEVYPVMKEAGGGKIINIASINSGHPFGQKFSTAYVSSKGAVIGITKTTALAWALDNIQVNAISPGWIESSMTREAMKETPELNTGVISRSPLGRWGKPEELAGAAMFLASKASNFVTGTTIIVDGGFSSNIF